MSDLLLSNALNVLMNPCHNPGRNFCGYVVAKSIRGEKHFYPKYWPMVDNGACSVFLPLNWFLAHFMFAHPLSHYCSIFAKDSNKWFVYCILLTHKIILFCKLIIWMNSVSWCHSWSCCTVIKISVPPGQSLEAYRCLYHISLIVALKFWNIECAIRK